MLVRGAASILLFALPICGWMNLPAPVLVCAAAPSVAVLPKCWGTVTGPASARVLVCQNPCIGSSGCTHVSGTPPGGYGTGQSCKCQGGSVECCDIWLMDLGDEIAAGTCGGNCPGSGDCVAKEDTNGDVYARCE